MTGVEATINMKNLCKKHNCHPTTTSFIKTKKKTLNKKNPLTSIKESGGGLEAR